MIKRKRNKKKNKKKKKKKNNKLRRKWEWMTIQYKTLTVVRNWSKTLRRGIR